MRLTLFGMGGDTFIPLSYLDQILSAEFFSKISNESDANLEDSACTVRVLLFFSMTGLLVIYDHN